MEKDKKNQIKLISYACAIVVCTLAYWILGRCFNFYYELNDDVLIKDVLSGIYTGTPEGHNMQMLYPISWLIKSLYSINSYIPWMGIIEIGLMWLCSVLLLSRTQYLIVSHIEKGFGRIVACVGIYACVALFVLGTSLWEVVIVQYTVVCGMLATTAGYLFFTKEDFQINENIISIILVVIAFNIRSEMFLLMCPFLVTLGICKWISEGINWDTFKKYVGFVAIIVCVLAVSFGIDRFAYRSEEWKTFCGVFDARTNLYDFTGIPDYESNERFYTEQFASEYDVARLTDYNFVLSDRIDALFLGKLSEYASEHNVKAKSLPYAVFEVVKAIVSWRTPAGKDALTVSNLAFQEDGVKLHVPYNICVIFLYVLAIIAAAYAREVRWIYTLPILLVMRTISWGFVFYKDRVNLRIAHPMYFAELVILVGVMLVAWAESDYRSEKTKKRICTLLVVAAIVSTVINCLYIPTSIRDLKNKCELRETYNEEAKALYNYTSSNPREYFILDVYSTVKYTERIFDTTVNRKGNTQLAGGWMALSPLDSYKQAYYKDEYKFITSNKFESLETVDEIKNEQGESIFYVYMISDVKDALKINKN